MPLIDPSQFKSVHSYSGPSIPDYNFQDVGIDRLGSKDTMLNRLTGSYYDASLNPYRNQNDQRYENQNWVAYVGNNAAALGAKTFMVGIPAMVGSLTSLAASPLALRDDVSFMDVFAKNPINQLADYIDNTVNDLTPRFQRSDYNSLSFLEQISPDRLGETLSSNIDSLAFLAQSFTGAGLVSKLGIGGKVAEKLKQANKLYDALEPIEQANRLKLASNIDFYSSLSLMTTNEAALEAKDASEQIVNNLKQLRAEGKVGFTDEEIKQKADQGGLNTFWLNMITGAVTNGAFMKMLSPMFAKPLTTRANQFGLQLAENGVKQKAISGVESFFFDKGNALGRTTLGLVEQIMSEGTEESIQYSIQKAAYLTDKTTFGDSAAKLIEDIASLEIFNLNDKERAKAFGLGALIGSGGSAVANILPVDGLGSIREAAEYRKQRSEAATNYNNAYTDLVSNSLALKNPDTKRKLVKKDNGYFLDDVEVDEPTANKLITDHNLSTDGGEFTQKGDFAHDGSGNIVPDQERITKLGIDATIMTTLNEFIAEESNKPNPDKLKLTMYRNELLSKLASNAFQSGTTDILLEQLDGLIGSPEVFAGLPQEEVKQEIEYMKNFVKNMEINYQTASNFFVPTSSSKEHLKKLEHRRQTFLNLTNRLLTVQDLVKRKQDEVNTLAADSPITFGSPELQSALNTLASKDKVNRLLQVLSDDKISQQEKNIALKELNQAAPDVLLASEKADSSLLDPFVKESYQLRLLKDTITDLNTQVDKVLNDKQWKASPTIAPVKYDINPHLTLSPKVTKETFEVYLQRKLSMALEAYGKQRAITEIHSDIVVNIITDPALSDPQKYEQIVKLIERIHANNLTLNDEARKIVSDFIKESIQELVDRRIQITKDIQKYAPKVDWSPLDDPDTYTDPNLRDEQYDQIKEKWSKADDEEKFNLAADIYPYVKNKTIDIYEDIYEQVDDVDAELSDMVDEIRQNIKASEDLRNLVPITDKLYEDRVITPSRHRMLKRELSIYDAVMEEAFDQNDDLSEDYTDIVSVLAAINHLTELKRLLSEKEGQDYVLDYKLERLEKVKAQVEANRQNKHLNDLRDVHYNTQALNALLLRANLPLTPEQRTKLDDLIANDPVTASAIIMDLLKGSKEDVKTPLINEVKQLMEALFKKHPSKFRNPSLDMWDDAKNPTKLFSQILTILSSNIAKMDPDAAKELEKFAKDLSPNKFLSTFKGNPHLTLEEGQALAYLFLELTNADLIHRFRESPLTAKLLLQRAKEVLEQSKTSQDVYPPSIAQERLLRELVILSASHTSSPNKFDNVIGMRSPAGAGKSTVMVPFTLKLLGLSPKNVLTSANKQLAAENIQESTKSPYPANTAEQLLALLESGEINPDVQVIILDEAGAVPNELIHKIIGAFADFQNKNQDRKVKLWLVYDPNQSGNVIGGGSVLDVSAYETIGHPIYKAAKEKQKNGTATKADLDTIYKYEKGLVPFSGTHTLIQNMASVSPISTSYRSNVAIIGSVMDSFVSSEPVTSLTTATSKDVSDTQDIEGVFSSKQSIQSALSSIKKVHEQSKRTNPSRSRVVITNRKDTFTKEMPDAIVVTPQEAQGKSFDEAYIYLDDQGVPPFQYNQDMYTAVSRARKFVYNTSTQGTNDVDATIPIRSEAQAKLFSLDYDSHIKAKEAQLASYNAFFGTPTSSTGATVPDPNKPPTPDAKDNQKPQDPDPTDAPDTVEPKEELKEKDSNKEPIDPLDDTVEFIDVVPENDPDVLDLGMATRIPGEHNLLYPTNAAFTNAALKIGDQVQVFKESDEKGTRYIVVKEYEGQYHQVGIITEAEEERISKELGLYIDLIEPSTVTTAIQNGSKIHTFSGGDSLVLYVGEKSNKLTYNYDPNKAFEFKDNDWRPFVGAFLDQFTSSGLVITNLDEIMVDHAVQANGRPYVSTVIYTEAEAKKLNHPAVKPYVPYMVIEGLLTSENNVVSPQYIQLTPAIISDDFVADIREYIYNLNKLINRVGEHPAFRGTVYARMAPGFSIKMSDVNSTDTRNIYYPFAKFVAAIADARAEYNAGNKNVMVKVASDELIAKLQSEYPAAVLFDIKYSDIQDLGDWAEALDHGMHGNSKDADGNPTKPKNAARFRKYQGPIQRKFDAISRSNYAVTTSSGRTLILRDYTGYAQNSEGESIAVGLPLLGRVNFEDKGASINPIITPKSKAAIQQKYDALSARGEKDSTLALHLGKILTALNEGKDVHLTPLEAEDLYELFIASEVNDKLSNVSEGFGLRKPLSFLAFKANTTSAGVQGPPKHIDDMRLEGEVVTHLSSITPTAISLSTTPKVGVESTPPPTRELSTDDQARQYVRKLLEDSQVPTQEHVDEKFPGNTLDVDRFMMNAQREIYYETRSKLIQAQLKRTVAQNTLEDQILYALQHASDTYTLASKQTTAAPRDYLRSFVLSFVMNNKDYPKLATLASKIWISKGDKDSDKVSMDNAWRSQIQTLLGDKDTTRLSQLEATVKALAKKYNIQYPTLAVESHLDTINAITETLRELSKLSNVTIEKAEDTPIKLLYNLIGPGILEDVNTKDYVKSINNEALTKLYDFALEDAESVDDFINYVRLLNDNSFSRDLVEGDYELGDNLTHAQARALYNKMVKPSLLARIRSAFSRKRGDMFQIVSTLYMQNKLGKRNYGLFKDGVVYVVEDSGNVKSNVIKHEVFHKVVWNYLSPLERVQLFDLAKEKYKLDDMVQLEEALANDFMVYKSKPKSFSGKLKILFRKILNFFGFTYNNLSTIDAFFDELSEGIISGKETFNYKVERNLAERWPSVESYTYAKETFLDVFHHVYSDENVLTSFDDALQETVDHIRRFIQTNESDVIAPVDAQFATQSLSLLTYQEGKAYKEFIGKYFKSINSNSSKEVTMHLLQNKLAALESGEITDASESFIEEEIEATKLALSNIEAELVDPMNKINGRIKQRLVTLPYKHKQRVVRGDFYSIFNSILPLVQQAPNTSVEEFLDTLHARATSKVGSVTEEIPTTVRRAGAKFLQSLPQRFKRLESNSDESITFFKDSNYQNEYAIQSTNGSSTRSITHTDAINNPHLYRISVKPTGVTTADWVNTLSSTQQAANSYRLFEELTFISSLISSTASLYKARPFMGVGQYRNYQFTNSYASNRVAGREAILENSVVSSILNTLANKPRTLLTDSQKAVVLKGKNDTTAERLDRKNSIKQMLLALNLPSAFVTSLSPSVTDNLYNHIQPFFQRVGEWSEIYNETENFLDLYESVTDEGLTISLLVDIMSESSALTEVSNFIRADGRRAYLYRDSSYQTSLGTFLLNRRGTFGPLNWTNHGKLTTTAPILQKNKFVNGSIIYDHIQHDGLKAKFGLDYTTLLTGEKDKDYFNRTFQLGFLSRLRSSGSKASYYQFLPVPSNRTTVSAFEVQVTSNAKQEIKDIVLAQQNRPDPSTYPLNKNYANNYKKFTLPGLSPNEKGTTEQLVEKVMNHIKSQSVIAAEKFLATNPKLDLRDIDAGVTRFELKIPNYMRKKAFDTKLKTLRKKKGATSNDLEIEKIDAEIAELQETVQKAHEAAIYKLFEIFYGNHIINQYSLSQLVYSDEVFYGSKEVETKRIQSATGSGDVVLSDPKYGLSGSTASKILVLEDVEATLPKFLEDYHPASFLNTFEETDGQGFITPKMYELLAKAQGAEAGADIVLKPLLYYVTPDGEPKLIKYSIINLTDEFINGLRELPQGDERVKFFTNLRETLDANEAGTAVFQSAFKLGSTSKGASIRNDEISHTPESFVTIDPSYYRFQLNPATDVDVNVANFSQATAMVNTNGQNEVAGYQLHRLNQIQIELGLFDLASKLHLDHLHNPTSKTTAALRSEILRQASDSPATTHLNTLLRYRNRLGEAGVSLNAPLVHQKIISLITSTVSSGSVGFRFPGSKLVLQTEFGTYSANTSKLKWKDENGYTEVLLPESYRQFLKEGDKIVDKSILGFRIPTSNLHSMQALTVKGFYKVPEGSLGNVIIGPSAMMYITGNDFDVDSLFVVRKTILERDVDLNTYGIKHTQASGEALGIKDGKLVMIDNKPLSQVIFEKLQTIQLELHALQQVPKKDRTTSQSEKLMELVTNRQFLQPLAKDANLNSIVHLMSEVILDRKNRYDLNTPITLDRVKSTKGDIKQAFIKAFPIILQDLIDLGVDPKYLSPSALVAAVEEHGFPAIIPDTTELGKRINARYDYITRPMSIMETLAQIANPRQTYWTLKEVEAELYPKGQLSDYLTQLEIQNNTYSGLSITGIAANSAKTIAYVFHAGKLKSVTIDDNTYTPDSLGNYSSLEEALSLNFNATFEREIPTLDDKHKIRIDKGVYDSLSRTERVYKEGKFEDVIEGYRPVNVFETLDTIINLAIDNVKEQKLNFLGITNDNANVFIAGVSLGIPLKTLVLMFKGLKISGRATASTLNSALEDAIREIDVTSLDGVSELSYSGTINEDIVKAGKGTYKDNLISMLLKNGYVSTKVLTEGSPKAKALNQLIILKQLAKLADVGEELFKTAQVLSSLRGVANEKWKIDYLDSTFMKLNESSVFTNTSLHLVPNIDEASAANKLAQKVIEHTVLIYDPKIQQMVSEVTQKFVHSPDEKTTEYVTRELLKMLTADLSIVIDDQQMDLNLRASSVQLPSGTIVHGAVAFGQTFIRRVEQAQKEHPDSIFLKSLEIVTAADSSKLLNLTANSTGEEEVDLALQRSFLELYQTNRALALDFLVYEVKVRGLLFGRTSISSVFPPFMIAAITSKLDGRLEKLLSSPTYRDNVKSLFVPQFLRNNPTFLKFLPKFEGQIVRPNVFGYATSASGSAIKLTGGSSPFVFDLSFDVPLSDKPNSTYTFPNYIRTYGEEAYVKIAEVNGKVYYRQITKPSPVKDYSFTERDFDGTLDMSPLVDPNNAVIFNYSFGDGEITHEIGSQIFKEGDEVMLPDTTSALPRKITSVTIGKARVHKGKVYYKYLKGKETPLVTYSTVEVPTGYTTETIESSREAIQYAEVFDKTVLTALSVPSSFTLDYHNVESTLEMIDLLPNDTVVALDALKEAYAFDETIGKILNEKLTQRFGVESLDFTPLDQEKYFDLVKSEYPNYKTDKRGAYVTPRDLKIGDIIQVGRHNDKYIFGKVHYVQPLKAYIKVFSQEIFNKLTDDNFDDLYNKTC